MNYLLKFFAVALILVGLSSFASAQVSLSSLSNGSVDIQAQKGKVVVLAVGASWLPLSNRQASIANVIAKKYSGKNVVVYFIATDSDNPKSKNFADNEKLRQWAAKMNLTPTVLRDPDGSLVLKKFSIDQLPSFVVLDKNGKQAGDAFGGIDPKFDLSVPISARIDPLL